MHIKILGSAGQGGLPTWNCACTNCQASRFGRSHAAPRTQTQIAFSPLDGVWFLIGASPDLRAQILAAGELSPAADASSPIAGLILPSADLEMVEGLLQLNDARGLFILATSAVQRVLKTENRIFEFLNRPNPQVQWQAILPRRRVGCHLSENPGDAPTFFYSAIPLGGSYPDYLSDESRRACTPDEARVGLLLEQADKKFFVAPQIQSGHSDWLKAAESADISILDASLWRDLTEHLPKGSGGRKVLVHLHHESPLLDEHRDEYRAAVEAGFEIAYDGMDIRL